VLAQDGIVVGTIQLELLVSCVGYVTGSEVVESGREEEFGAGLVGIGEGTEEDGGEGGSQVGTPE